MTWLEAWLLGLYAVHGTYYFVKVNKFVLHNRRSIYISNLYQLHWPVSAVNHTSAQMEAKGKHKPSPIEACLTHSSYTTKVFHINSGALWRIYTIHRQTHRHSDRSLHSVWEFVSAKKITVLFRLLKTKDRYVFLKSSEVSSCLQLICLMKSLPLSCQIIVNNEAHSVIDRAFLVHVYEYEG